MYEAVRVRADGPTTVARFASTVARSGFDGLVVRNRHDDWATYDREEIADALGIDVARGIEIHVEDKAGASGAIGNYRPEAEVLVLQGRDPELNRYAAESPRVDVLADPMGGEGDVNHVIVKEAAKNGVHLEMALGPVLRMSGGPRVQALRGLRKLRELVEAYDAPFVVSAAPETHLQVRGWRELVAVGETIGFDRSQIRQGLSAWGAIAERTRERRSAEYVAPGVRREEPERTEE